MAAIAPYYELANFTYYFFQLISLEILVSIVFTVDDHNNIKWTFANGSSRFKKTSLFVGIAILIAVGYYYAEKQVNEPVVDLLSSFDYKLLPLSVASIAFFAFYLTKVGLGRRWRFPLTYITLSIFLISIGTFGYLNYVVI